MIQNIFIDIEIHFIFNVCSFAIIIVVHLILIAQVYHISHDSIFVLSSVKPCPH